MTNATPTVISHVLPGGSEEPIGFASSVLSKAERRYDQVEKELLPIISAIRKFNQYPSDRDFTILIDHTPLQTIYGPDKSITAISLKRLQPWDLMGHDCDILYLASAEHCNTDALV